MGRGRKRASAGRKRHPAVAAADGADRTDTPQTVLDALHSAAAMCRTRIPVVTTKVATLARSFAMLPDLERDLELGFRALRGLSEATEAVAAYLTMLAYVVKQLPAVMEPDQARVLDEHRTPSGLQTLWHKLTERGQDIERAG